MEGTRPGAATTQNGQKQGAATSWAWTPTHVILGGWPEKTARAEIENDSRILMNHLPAELKQKMQNPYSPRLCGGIAKVRVRPSALQQITFSLQKWMEKHWSGRRPTWEAIERSPEAGARRRRISNAKELLAGMYIEGVEVDMANGDILKNKIIVAKVKYGKSEWNKLPAWDTVVQEPWEPVAAALAAA